jgi:hypothetical protein
VGIKIDYAAARERLVEAYDWASSERPVPDEWLEFVEQTFNMKSKTYTPALGTSLLARATDDHVDPLSIKVEYGPAAYSLRTLGHEVLVPAAREFNFSIRNKGREPLNNQPFFRYDHMNRIERVKNKDEHQKFMQGVARIESLDRRGALGALAAFLRVAIAVAAENESFTVGDNALTVDGMVVAAENFLETGGDRPKKTQALVAAAFDVTHHDVRSRKINDPSRDYPGDVQAFEDDEPILAVEVRAKSVRSTEVEGFALACKGAGIDRALMVILWPGHHSLPTGELRDFAMQGGVLLAIIENVENLLLDVFGWSDASLDASLQSFANRTLERLREIEADVSSLQQWVTWMERIGVQRDSSE